ncbi:MAG: hypothetical protein LBK94_04955 [Prevotellaceae bacterium]|jgi:hypothetical protein|nr:hypothetical protein [Prevotellaceae bacterium]
MKNKKMLALQRSHKSKVFILADFLLAFIVIIACFAIFNDAFAAIVNGGFSFATMATIGNIDGVSDRFTAGSQISSKIWLVHVDSQLDTNLPFPQPNMDREIGTIPLKANEKMHYFIAIDDSVADTASGSKGDVTTDVTNTITFTMGGNRDQLLNFIEEYAGGRFILIYQICSEGTYYIMGTPCKPMVLSGFERKNDKDSRSISFTFTNKGFNQPYHYRGQIVQGAPATIATDVTILTLLPGSGQYNTPDNNTEAQTLTAVAGLANADKGRYIDIMGTGGTYPLTIEDNEHFILIDGQEWTATAGSRISFKVLDTATLIEQEGSRLQL